MRRYKSIILFTILLLSVMVGSVAHGQSDRTVVSMTDSVLINFRQSKWDLDMNVGDNAAALDAIDRRLSTVVSDSVYQLRHISIYGGASPEGSIDFNKFLSENRAATLFGWFDRYNQLSDLDKTFTFYGRDWEGVLRLAEKDARLPYRDETISLLRTIVNEKRAMNGQEPTKSLERIKQLRGGVPYQYLYRNIFPAVRASKMVIEYERVLAPEIQAARAAAMKRDTIVVERVVEVRDTVYIDNCEKIKRKHRRK